MSFVKKINDIIDISINQENVQNAVVWLLKTKTRQSFLILFTDNKTGYMKIVYIHLEYPGNINF